VARKGLRVAGIMGRIMRSRNICEPRAKQYDRSQQERTGELQWLRNCSRETLAVSGLVRVDVWFCMVISPIFHL